MNILITGGFGFVGQNVIQRLKELDYKNIVRFHSKECNLLDLQKTKKFFKSKKPTVVIHLAGKVGGIGANKANPGQFFYENIQMGINVLEVCRQLNILKTIIIGTTCEYPLYTQIPFNEKDLWRDYPEPTNAPYGIAKRALMEMSKSYNEQYGMNINFLVPSNMYGIQDSFDILSGHVIPSIIRKINDASKSKVKNAILWGTGNASREFLYAPDFGDALDKTIKICNTCEPINIGTGQEITIKDLANKIAVAMKFPLNRILFNSEYPDGQPRRCLDTRKAESLLGFKARTSLDEGLLQTITWYKENYH